jgi:putative membrane protein
MLNDGYHVWGMHLIWWFVWLFLIFWIYATPYDIPFQRKKGTALEILQKRFAAGQITNEDYQEKKRILDGSAAA